MESELDTGGLHFHPEQGDERYAMPVAMALTRQINGKEQRIMIVGDADFLIRRKMTFFFSQAIFRWLSNGEFPLSHLRKDPIGNRVTISYKQADMLKYFLVLLVPGLLGLYGGVYLTKRRNL